MCSSARAPPVWGRSLISSGSGAPLRVALSLPTSVQVCAARERIRGKVIRSPLIELDAEVPGTRIFLKLENLQPLGSFKIRPAENVLAGLDGENLGYGVLTASAGNFGQGLAFAARSRGIPSAAVVPEAAAATKVAALERLGAKVIRVPFDAWWQALISRSFASERGLFIHPVAEAGVLAGNATIGAEILEDLPDCDAVVVPFGGGGLLCGVGSVMRRVRPAVRMIVVESEAAEPAAAALSAGRPVTVRHRQSFVDGMGSTTVLEEMWPMVREVADQAVCASFPAITEAIRLLALRHRIIAEPAGAASVAAALAGSAGRGKVVCIVSGGNIDAPKLGAILNGQNPF
jgi:threonine dehydratase